MAETEKRGYRNIARENIDRRLGEIKEGTKLKFRTLDILHSLPEWIPEMDYLVEEVKEIIVDGLTIYRISNGIKYVALIKDKTYPEWHWFISLDMLNKVEEEKPLEDKKTFSFHCPIKNSDILGEMMSKVDKKTFEKFLMIAKASNGIPFKAGLVNELLLKWAEAKHDIYLMFGRSLSIEKEVSLPMGESEMLAQINENIYMKFPKYYYLVKNFIADEFLENKVMGTRGELKRFFPQYTVGGKLSGMFHDLCKDKELDDALATILTNRLIQSTVSISINPFDIFTMSINNSGWQSCHELGTGQYGMAPLSYLLDSSTAIAFKYNKKAEFPTYTYNNVEVKWNSKSWRQCVYIDPNSASAIFSRQYPSRSDQIISAVRELYEETASNYLHLKNDWHVYHRDGNGYNKGSNIPYHDVTSTDREFKKIVHADFVGAENFRVGENVPCLICGETIMTGRRIATCGRH